MTQITYDLGTIQSFLNNAVQRVFGPTAGAWKRDNINSWYLSKDSNSSMPYGVITFDALFVAFQSGDQDQIDILIRCPTLIGQMCATCQSWCYVLNTNKVSF